MFGHIANKSYMYMCMYSSTILFIFFLLFLFLLILFFKHYKNNYCAIHFWNITLSDLVVLKIFAIHIFDRYVFSHNLKYLLYYSSIIISLNMLWNWSDSFKIELIFWPYARERIINKLHILCAKSIIFQLHKAKILNIYQHRKSKYYLKSFNLMLLKAAHKKILYLLKQYLKTSQCRN